MRARGGGLSYTAGQGHSGGHWGLIEGIQIFTGFQKDGPLWMLGMIRVHGAGALPGASGTSFPCSVCPSPQLL